MTKYTFLDENFFSRNTVNVAEDLIGCYLIHYYRKQRLVGRIVETEAYCQDDPACHAYTNKSRIEKGLTPKGRSALMFGPAGHAYIYLNYGMYWLFNVTTEKSGQAGAVLVRAVEPVEGLALMRSLRPKIKRERDLSNGPGKLTLAMAINQRFHGDPLSKKTIWIAAGDKTAKRPQIKTSPRIGISKATDYEWRFYDAHSDYISKNKS